MTRDRVARAQADRVQRSESSGQGRQQQQWNVNPASSIHGTSVPVQYTDTPFCVYCHQPICLLVKVIFAPVGIDAGGKKIMGEHLIHWACAWAIEAEIEAERCQRQEGGWVA